MSGLRSLIKSVAKNGSLLQQVRPLHLSSAQSIKAVAPRESLNSDFVLDLNYEFHYRDQIPFTDWDRQKNLIADVAMGIVWAFMFYKCYSEPEHLYGEFPYPDSSVWTDEELGIPAIE